MDGEVSSIEGGGGVSVGGVVRSTRNRGGGLEVGVGGVSVSGGGGSEMDVGGVSVGSVSVGGGGGGVTVSGVGGSEMDVGGVGVGGGSVGSGGGGVTVRGGGGSVSSVEGGGGERVCGEDSTMEGVSSRGSLVVNETMGGAAVAREGVAVTPFTGGTIEIEHRDVDRDEKAKVEKSCADGCGYTLANKRPCSSQFSVKQFQEMRGNAAELSWGELNMAVMGQIMALTSCDPVPLNAIKHRHRLKMRERNSTVFYHRGYRVCRRPSCSCTKLGSQDCKI